MHVSFDNNEHVSTSCQRFTCIVNQFGYNPVQQLLKELIMHHGAHASEVYGGLLIYLFSVYIRKSFICWTIAE